MRWDLWLAFLGASIAISVSPGAGAIQSMATGLTHGLRRGSWSIAGLQVGLLLQLVLVAVGLGAAVASSVLTFTVIKWLGVCYLLYLAARQWNSAVGMDEPIGGPGDSGRVTLLTRGFLVNVSNPKGLVFLLAVLPQFIVATEALLGQYLVIAATMLAVDIVVMAGYTGLAARLVGLLRTPIQQRALNRAISALFAIAAVLLSLVRRGAPGA